MVAIYNMILIEPKEVALAKLFRAFENLDYFGIFTR